MTELVFVPHINLTRILRSNSFHYFGLKSKSSLRTLIDFSVYGQFGQLKIVNDRRREGPLNETALTEVEMGCPQ